MPDVVLPCLNEAGALPWVLSRIPAGYRAIVADNGSTDGSAEVAREHGALVVDVPQRGFGAAAHAGLLAATDEIVCFMDADASSTRGSCPASQTRSVPGRQTSCSDADARSAGLPGRCMRGLPTPSSLFACDAVPTSSFMTWARCGRHGAPI